MRRKAKRLSRRERPEDEAFLAVEGSERGRDVRLGRINLRRHGGGVLPRAGRGRLTVSEEPIGDARHRLVVLLVPKEEG